MSGNLTTVLGSARKKLGYVESPPGSNRNIFSAYWKKPDQPWCADFATWALRTGGALDVPQSSYTPTLFAAYKKAGRAGNTPRVGALVFFEWPGMGRVAHMGIVESIRPDGSIITIEGNTDEAGGRTGGKVMRKVRKANIAGYGYPVYATPPKPKKKVYPTLRKGMLNSNQVRRLQTLLHIKVDGDFGQKTYDAVVAFQKRHRLHVDGVAGPQTLQALNY